MSKFGFETSSVKLSIVTEESVREQPSLSDTALDYALRYADIGWFVIPVRRDKKPLDGHGLNSATRDPALIRKIWGENPDANIAIACEKSGLVVIDIDPRNGGVESLAQWEAEHGVVHSSVVGLTQGGGEHRVFKAAPDAAYPGTLGAGIDLKHRGYILVEPSRGMSGVYRWQAGKDPTQGSLPTDAPSLIASRPASASLEIKTRPGSVIAPPQVYSDLRAALESIPPESPYPEWFRVLQGLSRLHDTAQAYALAHEWSTRSRSPGHTEEDFKAKWRTCMRESYEVSYTSVFYLADRHSSGWRASISKPSEPDAPTSSRWHVLSLNSLQLEPVDYLIDDFLARALMVFVGKPGMGKSTAMMALAAVVAGFRLPDSPLTAPVVGRRIIYITEDTDQFKRNLIALNRNYGLPLEALAESFALVPAHRVTAEQLLPLRQLVTDYTVLHECGVELRPWLVFDTTSASFHLEDENSNAEVAAVLALLKAEFYETMNCSVCMVAHSHKHSTRQDFVADPRGAGAWAGDTTLTSGIFEEDDTQQRFILLGKRRYSPKHVELKVELRSQFETVRDAYGRIQTVQLDSAWLGWSSPVDRLEARETAKATAQEQKQTLLRAQMFQLVRAQPLHGFNFYVDLTLEKGGLGCSKRLKAEMLNGLVDSGEINRVDPDRKRGNNSSVLVVDEERYAQLNGPYSL